MRDSFIFYRSFKESLAELEDGDKLIVYEAIADYALDRREPKLLGIPNALFKLIKPQLDANWRRFENGKKGASHGHKGGAPEGNKNASKEKTTSKQPQNNPKTTPNVNVNVNVNENVRDTSVSELNSDSTFTENIDYEKLVDFFNMETKGVFGEIRYPITDKRKKSIRARIREHGKEAFVDVIRKSMQSSFLKGDNSRGFTATFDWLIKPTNFEKTLSGNYDNKSNKNNENRRVDKDTDRLEELARMAAEAFSD